MSEKTAKILLPIFLLGYAAIFFFIGYFWGADNTKNSYPALKTIELIEKHYINKLSPTVIKALQYVAIESMMKYLDPHSHFFRPDFKNTKTLPRLFIETEIIDKTIGYIKIPDFCRGETYDKVKQIIASFKQRNIKGLIIDLRNNPGGNLEEAIKTIELFLEKNQLITTLKFENPKRDRVFRTGEKSQFDKPMVILVNNQSASASELFSGALRDYKRAILVGAKTFGKGVGQHVFLFMDGSVLALTAFYSFLPSGACPQGIGIIPDIIIEDPNLQFQAAIEILKTAG